MYASVSKAFSTTNALVVNPKEIIGMWKMKNIVAKVRTKRIKFGIAGPHMSHLSLFIPCLGGLVPLKATN